MAPLTFQAMISALQSYWEEQGCTIMQPYHTEVGAGTSNPATFLRVLGPEPWRTGYVEPSIRPDDGRYGENPFRFQQFYQYQVILKPAPDDMQECIWARSSGSESTSPATTSGSSRTTGRIPAWARPVSAGRCGWTGWRSPSSRTSSRPVESISIRSRVELAYGLERLAMYLQGVDRVQDVRWSEGVSWADVYFQNERQMSTYNYELADTAMHARHFDEFEAEARRCVEARLPLTAYDFVLKCSHAFNLLDSRRAIAVTDRAAYVLRMRRLAQAVAAMYLEVEEQGA